MAARRTWLVGYDITSPRRLRRVARLLEKHAWRLQYSLFVGYWNDREFEAVWASVAALIHPRRDDVRAWPLPEQADIAAWGVTWPSDIVLGDIRSRAFARLARVAGTAYPTVEQDDV